jgi:hypothetical protein
MSITRISSLAAIVMCQSLINQIEIGAGVATIGIYDGAMPADLETPIVAQNELVILELPSPAFADAIASGTGGTAVINTVPAVAATLSGTATFARLFNKNGDAVLDVDVSNADGNGALKLSSVTVVADVNVSVVSLTITQRKA